MVGHVSQLVGHVMGAHIFWGYLRGEKVKGCLGAPFLDYELLSFQCLILRVINYVKINFLR